MNSSLMPISVSMRRRLIYWLYLVSLLHFLTGLALPLAASGAWFSSYHDMIESAFWHEAVPAGVRPRPAGGQRRGRRRQRGRAPCRLGDVPRDPPHQDRVDQGQGGQRRPLPPDPQRAPAQRRHGRYRSPPGASERGGTA